MLILEPTESPSDISILSDGSGNFGPKFRVMPIGVLPSALAHGIEALSALSAHPCTSPMTGGGATTGLLILASTSFGATRTTGYFFGLPGPLFVGFRAGLKRQHQPSSVPRNLPSTFEKKPKQHSLSHFSEIRV
eukprot:TRINITY_DN7613_c0_g1_i1.p1 TRINITY_DN7613_c0_g1~~TRINITY_DN7613_c0_g1_i1.p1  ORF type:complete len:134 (+),score=5.62 TRINITY_DN7613_c0_g1_i1:156-557(+)